MRQCLILFDHVRQGSTCQTMCDQQKSIKSLKEAIGAGFWALFDVFDQFDRFWVYRKKKMHKNEKSDHFIPESIT